MEQLGFKLHTIIFLIGPDGSGKTKFVNEHLIPKLKAIQCGRKKIKVSYVGIDQISYELLDEPALSKYSSEFLSVEEKAYELLFGKISAVTSYPVNSDFVIVDTRGFDEYTRVEILKIGKVNHYNVAALLFNFDNKAEYFRIEPTTGETQRPDHLQMKEMKKLMSGTLSKKDYDSYQHIASRDFGKYKIAVEDYDQYEKYMLPDDTDYIVIGDIHGCLEEFKELLIKNDFEIDQNDKIIILAGDTIDKGYDIPGVIDFIHKNLDKLNVVIGNHENFVYRVLKGSLKKGDMPSKEVVDEYFGSIEILEKDEVLKKKFFDIFENSLSFFVHKNFIVTHASCENKYLGKISAEALKAVRNLRVPKSEEFETNAEYIFAFDEKVSFVKKDANQNYPLHIFGHIETPEVSKYLNKINIDTACVAGGCLTSISIRSNMDISYKSVPAGPRIKKEEGIKFNFFN